jgi:hypothetical protein
MVKVRKFLYVLLLAGCTTSLFSQTQGVLGKRFFDNWSVGIGGGPNIFFGDLKVHQFWPANNNMNEWRFGGTFTLTKQFSHVFAVRGQFLYSGLSGTKRQYKNDAPCNEYFDGTVMEGNINTTINFSNLLASGYKPHRKFFIYGTLGIGTCSWNTTVNQLYTDIPLRKSDSLNNWSTALMGMAGIGAFVNLGDKVNLGIEWTLHGVNSDWVDGTGGGFRYDAYSMLSLNITYNFNRYNPGKEPDTNLNKIYVPVYIPVPVKEETPDVVEPAVQTAEADTTDLYQLIELEFTEEPDSAEVFDSLPAEGITYRVQIFAFRTDKYTALEVMEKYHLTEEVTKDLSDGWYRFTVGSFTDYAEAAALKNRMKKLAFRDAFITSYHNGVRVPAHGNK